MKQKFITDFYKIKKETNKIKGYNKKTNSWHCLECGCDMGKNNPRQYCGKTCCLLK